MKSRYLAVLTFFLLTILGYSQNSGSSLCDQSQPICSSSEFTFPNTFDNTPAEAGPDYGCLGTQPNPAWFFLQIGQSGAVELVIEQSTSPGGSPDLDVDFIIYGPFSDVTQACQGELTAANTVDCSYSAAPVESVNIPNAQVGELYVLLITNFSGAQGYISVTQTSGSGATDCSILSTINGCEGSSITLDATTEGAVNYVWYEEDLANPGTFIVIPGINTPTYDVFVQKQYKAEAMVNGTFVLETYTFSTNFYETPVAPANVSEYAVCDNTGSGIDGVAQFDLQTKVNEILNGQDASVFSVSFHEQEADAQTGLNNISGTYTNTVNPQTIYARIYNSTMPDDLDCYDIVSFDLVVNQVPNVEGIDVSDLNQVVCEYDGNDIETFDLTLAINEVETWLTNNGQTPSDFDISLYNSQTDADAGTNAIVNVANYMNESSPGIAENPQTIYVRIADVTPGGLVCINSNINFQLSVYDAAIATPPFQQYIICDNTLDNGIDTGFGLFNLSATLNNDGYDYEGTTGLSLHEEILSGLPSSVDPADFSISFYSTQEGADAGMGHPDQLSEAFENTIPDLQTIFIRVENSSYQECYDTTEMTLEVLPLPVFNLPDEFILCTNVNGTELLEFPILDTQLDESQYLFDWYIDTVLHPEFSGMASITATLPGEYMVVVTNAVTGCTNEMAAEDTYTAMVYESSPPTSVTAELISSPFTESNTIQVEAEGSGISQYEFSLNNGPWYLGEASSTVFTHIFTDEDNFLLGKNIVRVRDINGCGWVEEEVTIMDYPLYFSPNGDGINDTWNIPGMENQVNAKIYIYDRFGKLLKSISPQGAGWDGTFNGAALPSSDYWFTVKYNDPNDLGGNLKEFSAHFALKR